VTAITGAPGRGWRVALLVAMTLAAIVAAMLVPPIRQDLAYHAFADQRALLGVPHGLNVLSNIGFLLVGGWALARVSRAALPGWERAAGLVFGVPAALAGSRFVESFLWGVEPGDPATIAAAAATSLLALCLAGYIPASRASRIDPLVALRAE